MLTKQDFIDSAMASIDQFPTLAALVRAGDPRIIQHIDANAAMLSEMSQQIEVAAMEGFEKVRPSTILADAAMRGIVPRANPLLLSVSAKNKAVQAVSLSAGRVISDSSGNAYIITSGATIAPGATEAIVVRQGYSRTITHTVSDTRPFYAIEIPASEDGSYVSSIGVSDVNGEYEWRNRYTNTKVGEKVFHVEADDRQRIYVRFGQSDVVGVQPLDGDKITLTIFYCLGQFTPPTLSPMSLDYVANPLEASIELVSGDLIQAGEDPLTEDELRDLARYPSTYTDDAVFLGEFGFLVRKVYPSLPFCSVWNEAHEELVRGAALKNINALFVAVMSATGEEVVLTETPDVEVPPRELDEAELTETQRAIRRTIAGADDSYRIRFFTPVISPIRMTVNARVASSYRKEDVKQQITDELLTAYGKESAAARRGYNRPLYQKVYQLLRSNVPALSGGDSDMTLTISEPTGQARPELWRYVSAESLTVNVETVNIVVPSWGG